MDWTWVFYLAAFVVGCLARGATRAPAWPYACPMCGGSGRSTY